MQQQYGNYPYYPQPVYPQTPYMGPNAPPGPSNGYPSFYGPPNPQAPAPAPQNPNPPAPSPYSFDAAAYTIKPGTTSAFPRRHRRNQTTPTTAPAPPLKSAMKKTMTNAFNNAEQSIARQFSNPFSQSQNQNPAPRPRVYSNPNNPPILKDETHEPSGLHMFVSFHGYNELHIENIMTLALDELRKVIWPQWPDGVESDVVLDYKYVVKFKNAPWDLSGNNVRHAYKLIVSFFRLFQERGYSFQTAVNIATPTPRLIFQMTRPDPNTEFFIAYFSQDGRRFTLVNPPNHIELSLGARLRSALPNKILSDNAVEEYTRVIEIKRNPNSNVPEVEVAILFMEVLRILSKLGFELDATVPLGRRGPLGIRYMRELLIFKGCLP